MVTMDWDDWFWLIFGLIGLALTAVDLWQRKKAGTVLLDLGRRGFHYSDIITMLMLTVFLYTRVRFHAHFLLPLFGIVGLASSSILAMSRHQWICEAGLLGQGIKLTRWSQIETYEISPIGALSLKLRKKGWTFFCDLAPDRYAEVESILRARLT